MGYLGSSNEEIFFLTCFIELFNNFNYMQVWTSQVALVVNNSPANSGDGRDAGWIPLGWEDPLEEGMATHSSILAWRIPWTVKPGGLESMGSQKVRHDWSNLAHTHTHSFYNTKINLNNMKWDNIIKVTSTPYSIRNSTFYLIIWLRDLKQVIVLARLEFPSSVNGRFDLEYNPFKN